MVKKWKLIIAYDGTNYCGWQIQEHENTVQGALTNACNKLFSNGAIICGSSRTDAGVHALGQVVTIEVDTKLDEYKIMRALNAHLPRDIVIQNVQEVSSDFHPRYNALNKTYVYRIYNARVPLPQYNRFSTFYSYNLDLEQMKAACKCFIGTHDFFSFSSAGSSVKTTVRTIYRCEIILNNGLIEIWVTGNGFLYNMVRIIVGTLLEIGIGKKNPEDIPAIFEARDRLKSGIKAPAKGLTLVEIKY